MEFQIMIYQNQYYKTYYNLKYSLAGTILYYVGLAILNSDIHLPIDIKLKLYSLNDLDTVVKSKNDYILSTLIYLNIY